MKNLVSIIVVFVLGINLVNAKPIEATVAQKVAERFYEQFAEQELKTTTLAYTKTSDVGTVIYYVFNINDGFVVVAADDFASPILNFSTQGNFIAPKTNDNVVTINKWGANNWAVTNSKG